MASMYATKNGRTTKRGAFIHGVWHCDCDPRQPADKFQTKNGGKNHGRWFHTCQKPQPKRCSFFLWSDEAKTREESAVLNNSRSEPAVEPQTPRNPTAAAHSLPTPDSKKQDPVSTSSKDNGIHLVHELSFDWPSSEDEELARVAESVFKHPPQPTFETPRKAARTDALITPRKRSHNEMLSPSLPHSTTLSNSNDVFATPSMLNRSNGLLSPMSIYPQGRSQAGAVVLPAEPSCLASDVLKVLETVSIPSHVEAQLIELLNRHDLRTQGIAKGREIARLAIQKKEKKIAELQALITGLEGEKRD